MEVPTARVMKEDSYSLGYSQVRPFRYYYGAVSPYKGLEIVGRITEVLGTEADDEVWHDYGNYKDKSLDLKYQLMPEGKYLPALSLGLMDPHGTRMFASQYLVASKQIHPFDLTLGFGNGWFGDRQLPALGEGIELELFSDPRKWLDESRFFWGLQFAPSEKYALMAEYSPVQYHRQTRMPGQPDHFPGSVPSGYNFGLRYRPTRWSGIDISWQRGEEIGLNLSVAFDIGKPQFCFQL